MHDGLSMYFLYFLSNVSLNDLFYVNLFYVSLSIAEFSLLWS